MGQWRDNMWVRLAMVVISVAIVALNFLLVYLTFVQ